MDRIWLKHYPPGVPAEIDPSRYPSLVALIDESFARYRGRTAFIFMDRALSYGEVDEMSHCRRAHASPS
jgi:long-chain acyl-CoA synthetase